MGVAEHLGIETGEYDRRILTFIPHYEELLDGAAAALDACERPARVIVDLGTGSGALASRCLERVRGARAVGIDADARMLEMARARVGRRLTTVDADFERAALPRCDAVTASLALHHVATPAAKTRLFARVFRALQAGGVLVEADCLTASSPRLRRRDHEAWHSHLARTYGRRGAANLLRAWRDEDTYFTLEQETALLRRAGFIVDVPWRRGAFAVVVAVKPRRAARTTRRA